MPVDGDLRSLILWYVTSVGMMDLQTSKLDD